MPALTPFCSLLDGSLHKHLICKVSVPRHGDPCQGRHPASPPAGAGGTAWGAKAPAECWRGRAVSCSTPGIPPLGHGWHRRRAVTQGSPLAPRCSASPRFRWAPSRQVMHLSVDSASVSPGCLPSPTITWQQGFMMVSLLFSAAALGEQPSPRQTLEPCAQPQLVLEPLPSPGEGFSGLAVVTDVLPGWSLVVPVCASGLIHIC